VKQTIASKTRSGQVNRLSAEIDRLQREIRKSEVDGVEASDLRDQRDARIRELSNLVPTSVHEGPNGSLAVLLGGGHALVHAEGGTSAMSAAHRSGHGPRRGAHALRWARRRRDGHARLGLHRRLPPRA
jgi:flagellar hook-associated protein FlgK